MKKLTISFWCCIIFSSAGLGFNQAQLVEVEQNSAITAMATSIIKLISPHGTETPINNLCNVAQQTNMVCAYALQDQSLSANIASVIDHVASSTRWQKAKAYDKDFFKRMCIETIHGTASETVESGKDYLLTYVFTYLPGNIIFKRSVDMVATALALALFDYAANRIKAKLIEQDKDSTESFVESFFNYLVEQATYHALAEIVAQNCEESRCYNNQLGK